MRYPVERSYANVVSPHYLCGAITKALNNNNVWRYCTWNMLRMMLPALERSSVSLSLCNWTVEINCVDFFLLIFHPKCQQLNNDGTFGSFSCHFMVARNLNTNSACVKMKTSCCEICRGNFSFEWIFICCLRYLPSREFERAHTFWRHEIGATIRESSRGHGISKLSCSRVMNGTWTLFSITGNVLLLFSVRIGCSTCVCAASRYASWEELETFDSETIARQLFVVLFCVLRVCFV